ncbi:MAG: hypothetical protein ACLF0P_10185 [Thermoanaerobaculia bacterium]
MKPPEKRPRPDEAPERGVPNPEPPEEAPSLRGSKRYRSPRLVTYGRLTDLTRFGGSQVQDSGGDLGNQQ